MRFLAGFAFLFLATLSQMVQAQAIPDGMVYHGRIIKPNGFPLEESTVVFTLKILSPNGTCSLYEETHSVSMANSQGVFSLNLGAGARTVADPGNVFADVFENASIARPCAGSGTYSATPGAVRKLQVTFNDGFETVTISPDHTLRTVPYALIANSVQGLKPANILQVNAAENLTQANLESLTTGTNYNVLSDLVAGTSSLYVKASELPISGGSLDLSGVGKDLIVRDVPTSDNSAVNKHYVDTAIGSGVAPSGTAGGDLSSSYPNPVVAKIQGDAVSATNPNNGEALVWSGGTSYVPTPILPLAGGTMTGSINMGTNNIANGGTFTASTLAGSTGSIGALNVSGLSTFAGIASFSDVLDMNSNRITEVAAPTAGTDATNRDYVDNLVSTSLAGAGLWTDGGVGSIYYSGGKVGIGVTVPTDSLHVYRTTSDPSLVNPIGARVEHDIDLSANSTNTFWGVFGRVDTLGSMTEDVADLRGVTGQANHYGTGSVTNSAHGVVGLGSNRGTGRVVTASGIYGEVRNFTAGGTINFARAISANVFQSAGTIERGYGVHIGDMPGTIGQYGIYQTGTDDINYFAGKVGIGTITPAEALHVYGNVRASTNFVSDIGKYTNLESNDYIIMEPSDDSVRIFSNDVERFTVLSNGNVGIGTTTPNRKLEVAGPIRISPAALPSSPAAGDLAFDSAASNALKFYNGTGWQTVGTGSGSGDFKADGSVPMTGNIRLNGNYLSGDGGSEGILVDNAGNVGIGVPSPSHPLDVSGNIRASAIVLGNYFYATGSPGPIGSPQLAHQGDANTGLFWGSPSGSPDVVGLTTGGSERMRIDANGRMSVGSTISLAPLYVDGTGPTINDPDYATSFYYNLAVGNTMGTADGPNGIVMGAGASGNNPMIRLKTSGGDKGYVGWDVGQASFYLGVKGPNNMPMKFKTNGADRITILNGGNVGIGTASPNRLLEVAGPIRISPAALPSSPAAGDLAFDSGASNALKYYDGSGWQVLSTGTGGSGFSSAITTSNTTASTSKDTGSLVIEGGAGIEGNVFAGGSVNAGTFVNASTYVLAPTYYGSSASGGNLTIDSTSNTTKGNIVLAPTSGNVGVGISTPAVRFDVRGLTAKNVTAAAGPLLQVGSNDSSNPLVVRVGIKTDSTAANRYGVIESLDGSTGVPLILQPSGSNVGIGTASPSTELHVDGRFKLTDSTPVIPAPGSGATVNNFDNDITITPSSNHLVATGTYQYLYNQWNSLTVGDTTTATDLRRLYTYADSNSLQYKADAPTTQLLGSTNTVYVDSTASGNVGLMIGLDGSALHVGSGTVTDAKGLTAGVVNAGTGAITNAVGVSAQISVQSGTNMTTARALEASILKYSTGSVLTGYGLYIEDIIANTDYGVYQSAANDDNYFAGKVGLGQTSPSAVLHLKAGTAAANTAPLKFTSGTNLTAVEDGAMEFDGTNFYLSSGGVRRTIATGSSSSSTSFASAITTIDTTASTSKDTGSLVIEGGAGIEGNVFAGGSVNAGTFVNASTYVLAPTYYGSSASGGNLTIDSTSNTTKGNIILAPTTGSVGVGTAAPTVKLDVIGEIKVGNAGTACNSTTEGALRYNSTAKQIEFCNGTAWGSITSGGTIVTIAIGAPSQSVVKSGPVTFTVTYGAGVDSATISLGTSHISFSGTGTTGCSATSVTGSGLTRTVTVGGCTATGTVAISIASNTASSTSGAAAPASGASSTFQADNTGPTAPTGVSLGSVPFTLANSPTITYTAASDVGGSTVANHQVRIIRTSDSAVIRDWANHTSGGDVGGLSLALNTQYSVLVRAVDAVTNVGTQSTAVNWTTISDACLGTPSPGTVCTGGAIYLGSLSPGATSGSGTNKYMTTPGGCGEIPAGQIGGGSGNSAYPNADFTPTCSGTDSLTKFWNNGSFSWLDVPGLTNYSSDAGTGFGATNTDQYYGSQNTTNIVAVGGNFHAAARYCDRLSYGGYTDWHLPNRYELNLFYDNLSALISAGAGINTTNNINHYWSSTQQNSSQAWAQSMYTGYNGNQYIYNKANPGLVRCVRRY